MAWWRPQLPAWLSRLRSAPRNATYSISDPALSFVLGGGNPNYSGVEVNEHTAFTLSSFYRGVALIAGTIGGLPLRSMRDVGDRRERYPSWVDTPAGSWLGAPTPFSWKQTCVAHFVCHGNIYLQHRFNSLGSIIGLTPVHPLCVSTVWDSSKPGGKRFDAIDRDGRVQAYDATTMTQVMALSLDGLTGLSVINQARNGIGTGIAGDRAAANLFGQGALISGMVTPDEDLDDGDDTGIEAALQRKVGGWENASAVKFFNRKLKFTPWTMSMEEAQFLQSRQFQIEEIARWLGIPPHLLMQTEKQTSWGTGVTEQNRGLQRYNLAGITTPLEESLSLLLPRPRFVEFDYAGLLKPDPETEIKLLLDQLAAGVITVDEFRRIRNMGPLPTQPILTGAAA